VIQFGFADRRLTAIFIFGLALVVRLVYILSLPPTLSFDEPYYDDLVRRFLTGQGYSFSSDAYHTAVAGQPTSFQEPVYPLFLSIAYTLFGLKNYVAARLCNAVLGALIPVVIVVLGDRVMSRGVGLVAGLLLIVQPSLVYFSGLLMTETLFTLMLSAGLCLLTWTVRRAPGYQDVVVGISIGLAILTRSILAGFIPVLLLWFWWHSGFRSAIRRAIFICIGCALVILPWIVRNSVVHGAFVPLTTKGGYNLYIYSFPVRDYDFNDRWDVIAFPDMSGLSEVERDRLLGRQGVRFIQENPALFLDFAFHKLVDFWSPVPDINNRLLVTANVIAFGWAAVFALPGSVGLFILRQKRLPFVTLLYLLVGYYMLQSMVFTGGMKARLPVEPLIVLLAVFTAGTAMSEWLNWHNAAREMPVS